MNAARRLAFGLLALAGIGAAHARLGDTPAEAEQHYGAPTAQAAKAPATQSQRFASGALTIEADFIGDAVHRITYRQARPFTDEEVQKILADNAGGRSWRADSTRLDPARAAVGASSWTRSDRGSALLSRVQEGDTSTGRLVLTDGVWLAANLKLKLAPTPAAASAPAAPAVGSAKPHALTWKGYDGTGDPTQAHLVLDAEDLGAGVAGLAQLKEKLAQLPGQSQVKLVPYYGDPGAAPRRPPLDLTELKTWCDAHNLVLLIPQAQ